MPARPAIYLDSNAGGPPRLEVVAALLSLLKGEESLLVNPSSTHSLGRAARRLLNHARRQIAESFGPGSLPESIVFSSSGTEANQTVIRGILEPLLLAGKKPHWILSEAEHDSIEQMTAWLEKRGGMVTRLPLRRDGMIDFTGLEKTIRPETALLSLLWVNNETGVLSDVAQAVALARQAGIAVHLDGAQAWGKIPLDLPGMGADYVTFSGQKIGGLSGTGVMWCRPGARRLEPTFPGKQEKGLRGGTENLLGIVALGEAASLIDPEGWSKRTGESRDRLEAEIRAAIPGASVNGAEAPRVANTMSVSFPGSRADQLIMNLDLAGYTVSAGSACASGTIEPSRVILAMGASPELAKSTLRISLPDALPWEVMSDFVGVLSKAVRTGGRGE